MTGGGGWIEWLADSHGDVAVCGGKGAGLVRLARAGLPVPDAFFVTTDAFVEALGDVAGETAELLGELPAAPPLELLETACAQARERVLAASAGHPVLAAVAAAYERLAGSDAPVAVRSSSAAEDAHDASYAGEHDSYLWVRGAEQVAAAVARCWASLYTARAAGYRSRMHAERRPAMATVVQRMVEPRAAGVFMTLNPTNGDRSSVVIESVWGAGEPLVSGAVDPDRFVLDKVTGDVRRRELARKGTQMVAGPDGPAVVPVADELREAASLDREQLAELLAAARGVERLLGGPADGEFAVDQGVWILQARPETVWSTRPRSRPASGQGALQAVVSTLTSRSAHVAC